MYHVKVVLAGRIYALAVLALPGRPHDYGLDYKLVGDRFKCNDCILKCRSENGFLDFDVVGRWLSDAECQGSKFDILNYTPVTLIKHPMRSILFDYQEACGIPGCFREVPIGTRVKSEAAAPKPSEEDSFGSGQGTSVPA